MDINQAFPSKYLAEHDLGGQPRVVTVANILMEELDNEQKPCIYFQGMVKGVVLNKTNANSIKAMYGSDTDQWLGREVELYPTTTEFRGEIKPCIRIRKPGANVGSPAYKGSQPAQNPGGNFDPNTPPIQDDGWPGPR